MDDETAPPIITGNEEVVQPQHDLTATGRAGNLAQSDTTALLENTELSAKAIVEKSLTIAGNICVFTNQDHTIDEL